MKHVLARAQRNLLQQFARSNVVLAFDFDGTLAPIVPEPYAARLRLGTRRRLRRLAALYPCVVISGRARADVRRRLRGVGVRGVIGNHGLEPSPASAGIRKRVQRWWRALDAELAACPGVRIENKGYSLAVHYRRSRGGRKARAAILRAAARLERARLVGGKQVVNVLPGRTPFKGLALERERLRLGCEAAV